MAILNVPASFASVQHAMAAASAGDTIKIASGHVVSGPIVVTVENLTFDAPADVSFIARPADGIKNISLLGNSGIQLYGTIANNKFTGNNGANFLLDGGADGFPASGNDILKGGGGDDFLRVTNGKDAVDGGAGSDTLDVSYDAMTSNVIMSAGNVSAGASNFVTHSGIELFSVSSGSGNDELRGGAGDDFLSGNNGNDTFFGSGGADGMSGGDGDDTFNLLLANAGTFVGGSGNDKAIGSNLGNIVFGQIEVLDTKGTVRGTTEQLSTFATITDSVGAANSQIVINLHGPGQQFGVGGTLDLSTRITGQHSVNVVNDGLTGAVIITGSKNNDRLQGSAFGDTLNGGAGNDRLDGGSGADTLTGGDGNDLLAGKDGSDKLDGGAGIDTADYSEKTAAVSVTLAGSTLVNVKVGAVVEDKIRNIENVTGGSGADTLTGDGLANVLRGLGGNDTLNGGLGGDGLDGGAGTDTATYANAAAGVCASLTVGAAAHFGEAVGDTYSSIEQLTGSNFGDFLVGDALANLLTGLDGDDTLAGGGGGDVLVGGAGLDSASYFLSTVGVTVALFNPSVGNPSPNTGEAVGDTYSSIEGLIGSAFNDTLIGNSDDNRLIGAAGDDVLMGGLGADILVGATGHDSASYAKATTAVRASLANAASNTGEAAGDTYFDIERLIGSAHNDTLIGNLANNVLTGNAGADSLDGQGGLDIASYAAAAAALTASLAAGGTRTGDAAGDTYASIEGLAGSAFNDTLNGDAGDNWLLGNAGADKLNGGAGIDFAGYTNATARVTASLLNPSDNAGEAAGDVYTSIENLGGSQFNDTLRGNSAANVLRGEAGADLLDGQGGFDFASYFGATAGVVASLSGTPANTGDAAGDTFVGIEGLLGSAFADRLTGNGAANTLAGDFGADTLDGQGGNDLLEGGIGADALFGREGIDTATYANAASAVTAMLSVPANNAGEASGDTFDSIENLTGSNFNDVLGGNGEANVLVGGAGDDQLIGLAGLDTLTGGAGNDSFSIVEVHEGQADRITDFNPLLDGPGVSDGNNGADKIFLNDHAFFFNLSTGALAGDAFIKSDRALDAEDRIIYDQRTGKLYYDEDGSATPHGQIHFATLSAGLAMTSVDFLVF
jgi:Ca2+-binding RTX toxin-like protein